MLTVSQFAAIAVGAFYVFAGVVVMRAMALDRAMNELLAALNDPVAPKELLRSRVMTVGAFLTLAGGVALMLLSPLAALLFVANALWQGGYLLWAEKALPPEDDDDARGRAQTKNAFVVYLAATSFVVWLVVQGQLRAWSVPATVHLIDIGIMIAGCGAAWAFIHAPRRSNRESAEPAAALDLPDEEAVPVRLRLAPEWNCSPLWNADTGAPVSVYRLGLSFDLADRIEAWDDAWQATYNEADPASGGFQEEAARLAYMAEGRAIVEALRGEWRGELEIGDLLR
ncbi:MAG: hypothetical protein HOP13_08510 [Alphaproteobacteria bacterium]|nr:hypothetical protein [Alphaproteobacteria bacterium]